MITCHVMFLYVDMTQRNKLIYFILQINDKEKIMKKTFESIIIICLSEKYIKFSILDHIGL